MSSGEAVNALCIGAAVAAGFFWAPMLSSMGNGAKTPFHAGVRYILAFIAAAAFFPVTATAIPIAVFAALWAWTYAPHNGGKPNG